jgi:hypothetical protein
MTPEYIEFCKSTWSNIGDDLSHATIGLLGEILELQQADSDIKEELGDVCYYFARFIDILSIPIEVVQLTPPAQDFSKDVAHLENLVNLVKKRVYYGHTVEIKSAFLLVYQDILGGIEESPYTLEELCQSNMEKLKTRYTDGFTPQEAEEKRDHI